MRYDFSSQFLRVIPPDTSFGDTWESLCYALTFEDTGDTSLVKLRPPDRGIDFLQRSVKRAYQCKSEERGAFGSLSATPSIVSLTAASNAKTSIDWKTYVFATNANYTGSAHSKIIDEARSLGLTDSEIEFLGPEHWDRLCQKYPEIARERLDYGVSLTEAQVIEALRKARYFDHFIEEAEVKLKESPEHVTLTNNRTPIELTIPFSKELTIETLVDVAQEALGVSLDWKNYPDTKTSCGPSVSITIDRVPQKFRQKLGDIPPDALNKLQFFIQLVWQDETETKRSASDIGETHLYALLRWESLARESLTYIQRKDLTLSRTEEVIQFQIWENMSKLKTNAEKKP